MPAPTASNIIRGSADNIVDAWQGEWRTHAVDWIRRLNDLAAGWAVLASRGMPAAESRRQDCITIRNWIYTVGNRVLGNLFTGGGWGVDTTDRRGFAPVKAVAKKAVAKAPTTKGPITASPFKALDELRRQMGLAGALGALPPLVVLAGGVTLSATLVANWIINQEADQQRARKEYVEAVAKAVHDNRDNPAVAQAFARDLARPPLTGPDSPVKVAGRIIAFGGLAAVGVVAFRHFAGVARDLAREREAERVA
ncbi:MAG: hypothetical protein R3F65_23675 [bacterium]